MITLVVFSMDRAFQCDVLLRSISDHVTGVDKIAVIVRATSDLHRRAYKQLILDHMNHASFFFEVKMTSASMILADRCGIGADVFARSDIPAHVGLAVDDMMFFRPSDYAWAATALDVDNAFTWSWRLGSPLDGHIALTATSAGSYWGVSAMTAPRDYRYLFHTDGSLYRRSDLVTLLDAALPDWRIGKYIPNDIESAAATLVDRTRSARGMHLGPLNQTCITWQINKESSTLGRYGAPFVETQATTLTALAEAYLTGKRLDNDALYADPSWTTRFNPPGARPTHVHACSEATEFYAGLIR